MAGIAELILKAAGKPVRGAAGESLPDSDQGEVGAATAQEESEQGTRVKGYAVRAGLWVLSVVACGSTGAWLWRWLRK